MKVGNVSTLGSFQRISTGALALSVVLCLFAGLILGGPANADVLAGPIVNPANSHTYYLLTPDQTWTEAAAEANSLGGHLVTINDQAEQDWVWATFGVPYSRWLWIGLNDVNQEGTFEWSNCEPVSYTNWTPGEPNDYPPGEDYGEMDANWGGRWNDLTNDGWKYRHYGVVEIGPSFCVRTVGIDIKPGSYPNCFNINGHGVVPVAILGDEGFDVAEVDLTTILFGGLEVRVRGKKGPLCSLEYSNDDAYLDLVCHFEDDADAWMPGEDEATLTGSLLDGTPFEGTDSICVVP
jgi:hypothetical protein